MTPELKSLERFRVLGYTARTANEREMAGDGRIGPLWQKFMQAGIEIPGVIDSEVIFSLYLDYESDHTGEYSVVVGKSVGKLEADSAELKEVEIPAADYAVFPAGGATPNAIRTAWMEVYRYFEGRTDQKRAFTIDFERYTPTGVALYIALKHQDI